MTKIKGFTDSELFTLIPDTFFQKLLAEIDDRAELKVTLFYLWRVQHMEGPFRALCQTDFEENALGLAAVEVVAGLEKAVQRGSILKSEHDADAFYFLNSPRGRAAAEAFSQGNWREFAEDLVRAGGGTPKCIPVVRGEYRSADADDCGYAEGCGRNLFAGVDWGSVGDCSQK